MRQIILIFVLCVLLTEASRKKTAKRFTHAELAYPEGGKGSIKPELKRFMDEEAPKYHKNIVYKESEDTQNIVLQFVADNGKVGETVFANYLDLEMIRDILRSNGFYTKVEWRRIIDEEGEDVDVNEHVQKAADLKDQEL